MESNEEYKILANQFGKFKKGEVVTKEKLSDDQVAFGLKNNFIETVKPVKGSKDDTSKSKRRRQSSPE